MTGHIDSKDIGRIARALSEIAQEMELEREAKAHRHAQWVQLAESVVGAIWQIGGALSRRG